MLEYFDAFLIGLTATPSAQTFGFFGQNLVMEYTHEEAVADGVNVDSDIYRIRTQITEQGSTVEAGQYVDRMDRKTRRVRWEQLDEDLTYTGNQLDRDVVAEDQIRTVIRTFRDKLFTEVFPGRQDVPKTIIFAKDDNHADNIVEVVRREFDKGNDFCRKITYKEHAPEQLIATFRNSYLPRIVVTVDMIATGTDIKPVEIVFFMRNVQSRNFFEQMKGRGVRVISPTEFNAVTPDVENKDRFVIIDAVGVTESELSDSYSLEREPTKTFGQLLDLITKGSPRAGPSILAGEPVGAAVPQDIAGRTGIDRNRGGRRPAANPHHQLGAGHRPRRPRWKRPARPPACKYRHPKPSPRRRSDCAMMPQSLSRPIRNCASG